VPRPLAVANLVSEMFARLPTAIVVGVATCAAAAPLEICDWGPLYYRQSIGASGTTTRAAGPFWEKRTLAETCFIALRPLFAREAGISNRVEGDLLWPLGEFSSRPPEQGWRFLTTWYRCFDTSSERPRWRLWILPVYVQGRSAAGRDYAGLIPLGGRIEEFFGLDECTFVLWPVWSKQNDGELTTVAWFYPIWSRTAGRTEDRFRIFPFYGFAQRHGQYEKRFVMWPIWTWARYEYPASHGTGWILFPLYGRLDLRDQSSHLIFPPFIRIFHGQEVDRVDAPWPLVRIQRGRRNHFHLWPLYGQSKDPAVDRTYALWPIIWRLRVVRSDEVTRSWYVVPVLHWRSTVPRDAPEAPTRRSGRVWPLVSWEREGAQTRWRAPQLWPTWDLAPIERSWAPLWTLFEYRADTNLVEWELLWGLARRYRSSDLEHTSVFPLWERTVVPSCNSSSWSVLKGLIGFRDEGGARRLRLLYVFDLPLGGPPSSSCTNQTTSSRR